MATINRFCVLLLTVLVTAMPATASDALFKAIKKNDVATVKKLISDDKQLLHAQDEKAWNKPTVLQAAFNKNRQDVFDLLIELGADPNQKNEQGQTAVHMLRHSDSERIDQVLAAGGDINVQDDDGLTLLHYTVADRRTHDVAKLILAKGAKVNIQSNAGMTPLHYGITQGAETFLLEHGADATLTDWRGRTAAYEASQSEQIDLLAKHGVKLNIADDSGWTLLHQAAWVGRLPLVKAMLERGLPITQDDEGTSPLHAAARMNQPDIVAALIEAGCEPNLIDERGWTAADIAAHRGYDKVASVIASAPIVKPRSSIAPRLARRDGDNKTSLGTLHLERPTLICLGFRWFIDGDANRNSACAIAYRKKGDRDWQTAYSALRTGGEKTGSGYVIPHALAGSVFDLEPGTEYELRLTVTDPDGVVGEAEKIVPLATRAVPQPYAEGRKLHVYPPDSASTKQQPNFPNIQAAYDEAQPGDTILVHAGNHQLDLVMNKQATFDKPITIKGAGDGESKIQGQGNNIITVHDSAHHIFEDLTLHDAGAGFLARGKTHALTVRRCKFRNVGRPIFAISHENTDFLVTDCDMLGPVKKWHPRETRKSQGFWMSGRGHVACFNRIKGFWDGLTISNAPESPLDKQNASIDMYNNDLRAFYDDAIEMDYGVANIRVFRNYIRNTFMGISTQPLEGGPGYIFRNFVYASSRSPLKLNLQPAGLLIFHNTFIADGVAASMSGGFQNSRIYNNLFVGKVGEWIISGGSPSLPTDLDYNAYRIFETKRTDIRWNIQWLRVAPGFTPSGGGLNTRLTAASLDQFAQLTFKRFERHGGWPVEYDDFVTMPAPDVEADQHDQTPLDFRLRDGSTLIDKGKRLRYFNDNFQGKRPDPGAVEFGDQLPHFGPRN